MLGEYNRGHHAYLLNTLSYEEWSRIQSKLTASALSLAANPAPAESQPASTSPTPTSERRSLRIFLSNSHQDEAMKDRLHVFLAMSRNRLNQ